jgi:hypothetical protein
MRRSLKKSSALLSILLPALLLACGEDSTSPANTATGNYTAITFITTGTGGQRNEILAGSTLTLNLNANGTTSGHLHVAANGSDPAFDSDLPGTWTQTGTTVHLTMPTVDTFVEDMPLVLTANSLGGWDLEGDRGFSGTRIQLTLRRT